MPQAPSWMIFVGLICFSKDVTITNLRCLYKLSIAWKNANYFPLFRNKLIPNTKDL